MTDTNRRIDHALGVSDITTNHCIDWSWSYIGDRYFWFPATNKRSKEREAELARLIKKYKRRRPPHSRRTGTRGGV